VSGRGVVGRVDSGVFDSLLLSDGREFNSGRYLTLNVCRMNNDMTWTMFLVPDVETCCQTDVCLLGLTTRCFALSLDRSRRHSVESFRNKLVVLGNM
jgi:hypothetical protein